MFKIITIAGCTKGEDLCCFYPNKGDSKKPFYPDPFKIKEATRPECWYCNRSQDKVKKDRYKK